MKKAMMVVGIVLIACGVLTVRIGLAIDHRRSLLCREDSRRNPDITTNLDLSSWHASLNANALQAWIDQDERCETYLKIGLRAEKKKVKTTPPKKGYDLVGVDLRGDIARLTWRYTLESPEEKAMFAAILKHTTEGTLLVFAGVAALLAGLLSFPVRKKKEDGT